jgi:hypothetical protein
MLPVSGFLHIYQASMSLCLHCHVIRWAQARMKAHLLYFVLFYSIQTAVPFLPLHDNFHAKWNQAHQKLAMLPTKCFKDPYPLCLSSGHIYSICHDGWQHWQFVMEDGVVLHQKKQISIVTSSARWIAAFWCEWLFWDVGWLDGQHLTHIMLARLNTQYSHPSCSFPQSSKLTAPSFVLANSTVWAASSGTMHQVFYLGKRVAYVYHVKREIQGSKVWVIWGCAFSPLCIVFVFV